MSLLTAVRIAACTLGLLATAYLVYRRRAAIQGLRAFLLEPRSPLDLGALRIVLFSGLTWVAVDSRAVWWAQKPPVLRHLPPGWRALEGVLPIDATLAGYAQQLVVIAGGCAALGLLSRVTAPLAALSALYLLGIPSFFGKIQHYDHALMLCCLVVAVSPCGDALSLDRLWQRSGGVPLPGPSAAYTLPVRLCWLLLGTIYLFPGLWKVWENGDLWLTGEKLRWELLGKWGQQRGHFEPPWRIDQYPLLLQLLGLSTLVFEVGFFPALFWRRTRILAGLSAVAFHVGIRAFLGIRFYAWVPLIVLIDFPAFGAWKQATSLRRSLWPSAFVGGTLLCLQFYAGFAQVDSWPIALHPKFSERGAGISDVVKNSEIVLEPHDGEDERDLGKYLERFHARAGFVRLFLAFDGNSARGVSQPQRSRALVALLRENGVDVATDDHIALYRTQWNVFPIGKREGFKKKFVRRYRVTEDGALVADRLGAAIEPES
jgi:hypothetical protein